MSYLIEEPWNPKDVLLSQGAYFHGKSFSPVSYVVPDYVQGQVSSSHCTQLWRSELERVPVLVSKPMPRHIPEAVRADRGLIPFLEDSPSDTAVLSWQVPTEPSLSRPHMSVPLTLLE